MLQGSSEIYLLIITVSLLVLKTQGTDPDTLLTDILELISAVFLGEFGDFSAFTAGDTENVDSLKTFFSNVDTQMALRTLKENGLAFGSGLGKVLYVEEGLAESVALGGGFHLKFGSCPVDKEAMIRENKDRPLYQIVKHLFDGKYGINIYPSFSRDILRQFGYGSAEVPDPETAELLPCHGERSGVATTHFDGFVEGEEAKIGHGFANGCVEGEGSGETSVKIIDGDVKPLEIGISGAGLAYGIGNVEDLAKSNI